MGLRRAVPWNGAGRSWLRPCQHRASQPDLQTSVLSYQASSPRSAIYEKAQDAHHTIRGGPWADAFEPVRSRWTSRYPPCPAVGKVLCLALDGVGLLECKLALGMGGAELGLSPFVLQPFPGGRSRSPISTGDLDTDHALAQLHGQRLSAHPFHDPRRRELRSPPCRPDMGFRGVLAAV